MYNSSDIRLLVTGDRNWRDPTPIYYLLVGIRPAVLIHGDCRGLDKLAGYVAQRLHVPLEIYPANWGAYGKAAGMIRNQQMLDEGKPSLVIGFHDNITESAGTADMLCKADDADIPYTLITH